MNRGDASDADLAWCYDAVQGVSRTFAITIAELEEPMAREICVGYLLCRVADTIEDADRLPPAEQVRLLELYARALDPDDGVTIDAFRDAVDGWLPAAPDDDWRVVANAPRVLRAFRGLDEGPRDCIRPPVRELVGGMAGFIERYAAAGGLRIRTIEELEEYCWYAAGTVGCLVTDLVSRDAPAAVAGRLEDNARSFALLLQLVNVAKDVATDYEAENNVYLPREWLRAEGVAPEGVADPGNADSVAAVVRRVAAHAEGYLDGAQAWLEAMPESRGNTLAAWAIPFLLAVGTIRELHARPEDVVLEGDAKVSRDEVAAVIGRFGDGVDADDLADLRRRVRADPLHEH